MRGNKFCIGFSSLSMRLLPDPEAMMRGSCSSTPHCATNELDMCLDECVKIAWATLWILTSLLPYHQVAAGSFSLQRYTSMAPRRSFGPSADGSWEEAAPIVQDISAGRLSVGKPGNCFLSTEPLPIMIAQVLHSKHLRVVSASACDATVNFVLHVGQRHEWPAS